MSTERMVLLCDGAAAPTTPGPMGAGYILQDDRGGYVEGKGVYVGIGTNNVAEYTALIKGVEAALRLGATHLDIRTDSQLVVNQVHGRWVVNTEPLRQLRDQVRSLLARVTSWTLQWVPREQNMRADTCANEAARLKRDVDLGQVKLSAEEAAYRRGVIETLGTVANFRDDWELRQIHDFAKEQEHGPADFRPGKLLLRWVNDPCDAALELARRDIIVKPDEQGGSSEPKEDHSTQEHM